MDEEPKFQVKHMVLGDYVCTRDTSNAHRKPPEGIASDSKGAYWLVLAGPFKTPGEAEALAQRMNEQHKKDQQG